MITTKNENPVTLYGNSSDEKPTNSPNGSIFIEIDSGESYRFDQENTLWIKQPAGMTAAKVKALIKEEAIIPVSLTDGTMTIDEIIEMLRQINSDGEHVLFDASSLNAQMYLTTIYVDNYDSPTLWQVNDIVTNKFAVGQYDASLTLADMLANATTTNPEIIVTTAPNAIVTASKTGFSKTARASVGGVCNIEVPTFGVYTVSSTDNTETNTKTINIDAVKQFTLSLPLGAIYGVEWDRTNTQTWARTDDASLFIDPVPYVAGMEEGEYSSPFDDIYPWSQMKIVDDATVGKLVSIPKFYYQWTTDSTKMKLQITRSQKPGFHCSPSHMDRGDGKGERDVVYVGRYHCSTDGYKSNAMYTPKNNITRATARTSIHNLGTDIWQLDHALWWTIEMLYLVEFANPNCQGTIGYGRGNGSGVEVMGYTDTMPYHTGTMLSDKSTYGCSTQYRYIEGLWDNVFDWCDGIYFSGANVYHILNPADFSDTENGTLTGSRATTAGKVIKGFTFPNIEGFEWAGYPSNSDIGTTGTSGLDYFGDEEFYQADSVVLGVGGSYDQDQYCGLFFLHGSNSVSESGAVFGCRLQKLS